MLKLSPILIAILYAVGMYMCSRPGGRTASSTAQSTELADAAARADPAHGGRSRPARSRVHIFEIDPVNGLAAPDGRIFITRGFYNRYVAGEVTAAELASVIAHELGHVALGHARRRMLDFSGQNAIRVALGGLLNRVMPGFGFWLAGLAASLLAARLSRQDEYEADAYASALLTKAGIGTAPQKSLFAKLDGWRRGASAAGLAVEPPEDRRPDRAIEAREARWRQPAANLIPTRRGHDRSPGPAQPARPMPPADNRGRLPTMPYPAHEPVRRRRPARAPRCGGLVAGNGAGPALRRPVSPAAHRARSSAARRRPRRCANLFRTPFVLPLTRRGRPCSP
jgi:putative metalloprotease